MGAIMCRHAKFPLSSDFSEKSCLRLHFERTAAGPVQRCESLENLVSPQVQCLATKLHDHKNYYEWFVLVLVSMDQWFIVLWRWRLKMFLRFLFLRFSRFFSLLFLGQKFIFLATIKSANIRPDNSDESTWKMKNVILSQLEGEEWQNNSSWEEGHNIIGFGTFSAFFFGRKTTQTTFRSE